MTRPDGAELSRENLGEMADLWDKFFGAKVSPNPSENLKWIENEQLKLLLKEAHDKMDDDNVKIALGSYCRWCKGAGYDSQGLIHEDDCILVKIRHVIRT